MCATRSATSDVSRAWRRSSLANIGPQFVWPGAAGLASAALAVHAECAEAAQHDLSMAARFATHALVFTGATACVSGPAQEVLDEATLSAAFGHRVRRLVDGETVALVAG